MEWVTVAEDEGSMTAEDGTKLYVRITVDPKPDATVDAEHYQVARRLVTEMARRAAKERRERAG